MKSTQEYIKDIREMFPDAITVIVTDIHRKQYYFLAKDKIDIKNLYDTEVTVRILFSSAEQTIALSGCSMEECMLTLQWIHYNKTKEESPTNEEIKI